MIISSHIGILSLCQYKQFEPLNSGLYKHLSCHLWCCCGDMVGFSIRGHWATRTPSMISPSASRKQLTCRKPRNNHNGKIFVPIAKQHETVEKHAVKWEEIFITQSGKNFRRDQTKKSRIKCLQNKKNHFKRNLETLQSKSLQSKGCWTKRDSQKLTLTPENSYETSKGPLKKEIPLFWKTPLVFFHVHFGGTLVPPKNLQMRK